MKKQFNRKNRQQVFLTGLILLAVLVFGWQPEVLAQTATPTNVYEYLLQYQPETYDLLKKQLDGAIEDAKQPLAEEVVSDLWALSPNNPQIKWRENNGKIEYLMSSWRYKEYYPWSGLGYTYDWGNPQKPHVGSSEFIINPTAEKPVEVEVVSVTPTQEYCHIK